MKYTFDNISKAWKWWLTIGMMIISVLVSQAKETLSINFRTFPELSNLPCKDVQSIYQDRDGYIWVATRNGLFQFDGYQVTTYKSNMHHPCLLTDNNVTCMAEDSLHRLWVGTINGLNVLDKTTGRWRKFTAAEVNFGSISQLLVTRTGQVFVGADQGLFVYQPEDDSFLYISHDYSGGVFPGTSVKALMEDDRGDIWIGTWNAGLFRIEAQTGRFVRYPQMNAQNSAHVLYQDSWQRVWVGTWGGGLHLLENAYEVEKTTWTTFFHQDSQPCSLSDNLVYSLSEDLQTKTLWVGTRSALSILPLQEHYTGNESFYQSYAAIGDKAIEVCEVASLVRDRQGLMWVGMIGEGVNVIDTRKQLFDYDDLSQVRRLLHTSSVRAMMQDDAGNLWLGIGTSGLGMIDAASRSFTYCLKMDDFKHYPSISNTVKSIIQSPVTGKIWVGMYDGGLFEYDPKASTGRRVVHHLSSDKEAWLCGDCVYYAYEDSQQNMWVATRTGLCMRTADGKPVRIDSLQIDGVRLHDMIFLQVAERAPGELWAATERHGVVRILGSGSDWTQYQASAYAVDNRKINHNHIHTVFTDSRGRIWVGSAGSGLNLYDEKSDCFIPVHCRWNLPGDAVMSILEDETGVLWLGTNVGLLKVSVADDLRQASFRLYTQVDGLQDNVFYATVAFHAPDGKMFFGGGKGYNSFYPNRLHDHEFISRPVITDLKIYNHSWKALPDKERAAISEVTPQFSKHLVLDHWHNNFTFHFSALEYANPLLNHYGYYLEGFDEEWQYSSASERFAAYNNLKSGDYRFFMRSSNSNGIWNEATPMMTITILPPPWKTWWAYLIYVACILGGVWYAYRVARNRMRLQNALHLREVEKEKTEELNHAKLQFFTNITHELLTPLTILSASVDNLKQSAPAYQDQYQVMSNNINRLIRLLQQILEFRKAESGNLKLKVSLGDLTQFIQRSLDSFRPLMQQKNIHFCFNCTEPSFVTWFDADKMDKILYNLFSNAAKYSRSGETVEVCLDKLDEHTMCLIVKDNGPGISKENQKNLFKRFYEGSYRKFNTIGTGIGLSLVRDLVVLHHGTIAVESEEGKGTSFIIHLPLCLDQYSLDERDTSDNVVHVASYDHPEETVDEHPDIEQEVADGTLVNEEHTSLLLVEDNEELLELMVKLLRKDYVIYTAVNGKKALEVLAEQEVGLIVSDVMMPEMDGIELCRYVKSHIELSHIPVILLTAKNQEEDRVEAYESGAEAFITKPFSLSVLHARINNLLRVRQEKRKDFKNQLVFEAKELDYTSIDEEFLKQAVDCVNRHLDDSDFGLTQFLEEMNMTRSTCFRKLKSLTGLSFVAFLRNIRVKAACRIMEENQHIRISELAYAVGFNDPRYFSVTFRKEIGMHPSEYMERITQGGKLNEEKM